MLWEVEKVKDEIKGSHFLKTTSQVAFVVKKPIQETTVQPLGQEDPLEKGMATTPVFLPGEFHV